MLNDVHSTLSDFKCIQKRLFPAVSSYVHYLTLETKRHSFKGASQVSGLHESRFCSLLNDSETPQLSGQILNRASRRALKKLKPIDGRYVILIDATIKARRGKKVENVRKHHSGNGFVNGHKFINFVILTPRGIIPLLSVPSYTKKYCRENSIQYQTENDIVEELIFQFGESGILSPEQLKQVLFIMDSGYDAKKIQGSIQWLGANFVSALKSNRTIQGKQVREYFREKRRWLPWKSIRLHVGNGGKKSRRKFSIRTATQVNLKGFGPITVVCSKAMSRARQSTKYLAASDPRMTGREIVSWYSKRWAIELWHKEMKQNYGFGDCHSSRFSATASHVNFCLAAYLIQKDTGKQQMSLEGYACLQQWREVKRELTKFGSVVRLKTRVDQAILKAVG